MVIRFLCPNGHQLTAPENLAGKAGKCPKCNTAFSVPTLEELESSHPEPEPELEPAEEPAPQSNDTPTAQPLSASGAIDLGGFNAGAVGVGSGKEGGNKDVFVFLCPNGHKLNGPPSMKGKPGQCPHCGARFRIPSDEDLVEPEVEVDAEPAFPVPRPSSGGFIPPVLEPDVEIDEDGDIEDAEPEIYVDPPLAEGHALGYIFARLWDRCEEDTLVELYLKEGEIVTPQFYCDNLSCREYGVFANAEGDSFSFTLIPWDDVRRINVRKVSMLPRPMFR